MAANAVQPNFMPPPIQFLLLPVGCYGISYDISTNATENDLPNGWNADRSNTYRQLIDMLNAVGFNRHQYSDYRSMAISAANTWTAMWMLRTINPPMKLQSTVLGMKMHYYHLPHLFDITHDLQLGGAGAPRLLGPTPAGLVQQAALAANLNPAPMLLVAPPIPLPTHTGMSHNAGVAPNWMR